MFRFFFSFFLIDSEVAVHADSAGGVPAAALDTGPAGRRALAKEPLLLPARRRHQRHRTRETRQRIQRQSGKQTSKPSKTQQNPVKPSKTLRNPLKPSKTL